MKIKLTNNARYQIVLMMDVAAAVIVALLASVYTGRVIGTAIADTLYSRLPDALEFIPYYMIFGPSMIEGIIIGIASMFYLYVNWDASHPLSRVNAEVFNIIDERERASKK